MGHIVDTLLQMERLCRSVDALLPERDHLEVSEDGVGLSANADGRDWAMLSIIAKSGLPVFAKNDAKTKNLSRAFVGLPTQTCLGLQLFAHPTTQPGGTAARIERGCGTVFRVSLADLKYRN